MLSSHQVVPSFLRPSRCPSQRLSARAAFFVEHVLTRLASADQRRAVEEADPMKILIQIDAVSGNLPDRQAHLPAVGFPQFLKLAQSLEAVSYIPRRTPQSHPSKRATARKVDCFVGNDGQKLRTREFQQRLKIMIVSGLERSHMCCTERSGVLDTPASPREWLPAKFLDQ